MAKTSQSGSETAPAWAPPQPKHPASAPLSENQQFLRGAITAFIFFHLIAIACWSFPFTFSPVENIKEFTRPYMIWAGLFQSWDFFAPNPKRTDSYVEAVVITQGHRQQVWAFPRMEQLGYFDRYREERYRKFAENLPDRKSAGLWPGVAKHAAGLYAGQADPPEAVLLIEFQAPILPGQRLILKPDIFYEYVEYVPAEDMK